MTVDANGSIHDDTNGRFAGHLQGEGDTAVLDAPAPAKPLAWRIRDEIAAAHPQQKAAASNASSNAEFTYRLARADGLLDALTIVEGHLGETDPLDSLRDELAAWQARRDWLNDRQEETGGDDDRLVGKWDESDSDAIALVQSFIERLGVTAAPVDFCRSCGDPRGSNRMTCDGCLIADEPDEDPVEAIDPNTCDHREHEPIGDNRHQCIHCGATWLLSTVAAPFAGQPNVDYGFIASQQRANWHGGA